MTGGLAIEGSEPRDCFGPRWGPRNDGGAVGPRNDGNRDGHCEEAEGRRGNLPYARAAGPHFWALPYLQIGRAHV